MCAVLSAVQTMWRRLCFARSADREPGWKVSVEAWLWKRNCSSKLKSPDPLRRIHFSPHSYSGAIKPTERALKPVTLWNFSQDKVNLMFSHSNYKNTLTRWDEIHLKKLVIWHGITCVRKHSILTFAYVKCKGIHHHVVSPTLQLYSFLQSFQLT